VKIFDDINKIEKNEVHESFEHLIKDLCEEYDVEPFNFLEGFFKRKEPYDRLRDKLDR
jgi:hypothetical protein